MKTEKINYQGYSVWAEEHGGRWIVSVRCRDDLSPLGTYPTAKAGIKVAKDIIDTYPPKMVMLRNQKEQGKAKLQISDGGDKKRRWRDIAMKETETELLYELISKLNDGELDGITECFLRVQKKDGTTKDFN